MYGLFRPIEACSQVAPTGRCVVTVAMTVTSMLLHSAVAAASD